MDTIEVIEEIKTDNSLVKANDQINTGLAVFENKKAELTSLASESKITISGIDDKENIKKADAQRKLLKAQRVQITKDGKAMRDQLTVVSRKISEKEKELIGIISPVEDDLQNQLDKVEAEKERLRQIEIEKENKRIQDRIDSLNNYNHTIDFLSVKSMSEDDFSITLTQAKMAYEAEQARLAEEERLRLEKEIEDRKAREAEEKRLSEERAELERIRAEQEAAAEKIREQQEAIRKEQEAAQAKLRAEQEVVEAEKRAIEAEKERQRREEEIKKAREEATEAARLQAIEDAKEADRLKKEAEEKARIEAEKKAARRPDKIKIKEYISAIKEVPVPELKTSEAKLVMVSIQELISRFDNYASEKAEKL